MWKAHLKADAWVLSKIQDGYLWLLDRTGVYAGTLLFSLYVYVVSVSVFYHNGPLWLWLPVLTMVGLVAGMRYHWQDTGQHEVYNAEAMRMEDWTPRHFFNGVMFTFLVVEVVALDIWSASESLGFLLYGYLLLTKIRDRDKKPFFKPVEKHDLAMERF